MRVFRDEVDADARQRGLTRARLSLGRIAALAMLLLGPAGALLLAIDPAHRKGALAYLGLSYFVAFGLIVKVVPAAAAPRPAGRRFGGGVRPWPQRPPAMTGSRPMRPPWARPRPR